MIEQFTYLLFIKQLDETETIRENEASFLGIEYQGISRKSARNIAGADLKISVTLRRYTILSLTECFLLSKIFMGMGNPHTANIMGDAIFKIPTPAMLTKLIDGIDGLELGEEGQ